MYSRPNSKQDFTTDSSVDTKRCGSGKQQILLKRGDDFGGFYDEEAYKESQQSMIPDQKRKEYYQGKQCSYANSISPRKTRKNTTMKRNIPGTLSTSNNTRYNNNSRNREGDRCRSSNRSYTKLAKLLAVKKGTGKRKEKKKISTKLSQSYTIPNSKLK